MNYLKVFLISAVPIIEIRGGFPLGIYLGLSRWEALLVSILGNTAIILPWLLALQRLEKVVARNKFVRDGYSHLIKRVEKKKGSFKRYGKFALFFFVAIPLPTTGAWSACVAARLFRISLRDSFFIISAGVITSGLILLVAKVLALSGLDLWLTR